jgi:hypothetical protein
MPLPDHIISVGAFICEKILREADGVLSAIRLVDFFNIQDTPRDNMPMPVSAGAIPGELLPTVHFFVCVIIKAKPGRYSHRVLVKIQGIDGDISDVGTPMVIPLESNPDMGNVPSGAVVTIEMNVGVKRFGTCYLRVYLDDVEATQVPFTLRSLPSPDKHG